VRLLDVDGPAMLLGVVANEGLVDVAIQLPRRVIGDVEQLDRGGGVA
jgi:hypothetical protein